MPLHVVVAASKGCAGIGADGRIPWHLPEDLAHFRELTTRTRDPRKRNAVIMGRRTWESLPEEHRPLKGRMNVVLSSTCADAVIHGGASWAGDLRSALDFLSTAADVENVFVVGGARLYAEALAMPACASVHVTEVGLRDGDREERFDAFFPRAGLAEYALWSCTDHRTNGNRDVSSYAHLVYVRRDSVGAAGLPGCADRHGEEQYLALIRRILAEGVQRDDRTGTGTLSVFGATMRFDLSRTFPLLTTKRVFWKGVVEELLWFLSGSTDAGDLRARGVRIWDDNGSRGFLDSLGFRDRREGDLGPVYGFQWRHFGADYKDSRADYAGRGVDQIAEVVRLLRDEPTSRRIVLSAWNPAALGQMALPPCHMVSQFQVAGGRLSCMLFQRSGDVGLGVPFNIASYALLTHMLAHVCGLLPGELVHAIGDAHIYSTHVAALEEQLRREPRPFPTLAVRGCRPDMGMDGFAFEDFELAGYDPHPRIAMEMAV